MELDELINRINVLYHKRKTEGLTEAELAEQTELRRQYINTIKGNVKSQLDRIEIVDELPEAEHHCHHGCNCKNHKH